MSKIKVVLALLTTNKGKYVVIHRLDENNYGLPGGKMNEGEEWDDALVREVFEETGILLKKEKLRLVYYHERTEGDKEYEILTGCYDEKISEFFPLNTKETHIKPIFMDPSLMFMLTKYKDYFIGLYKELGTDLIHKEI